MKISRFAIVSVVVALASVALAKLPVPNGTLGSIEGALDFCASADQQSADKYHEKKKDFAQGASEKELAEARASQDYKNGYKSATDELSKQPKDELKQACAAALAGKS